MNETSWQYTSKRQYCMTTTWGELKTAVHAPQPLAQAETRVMWIDLMMAEGDWGGQFGISCQEEELLGTSCHLEIIGQLTKFLGNCWLFMQAIIISLFQKDIIWLCIEVPTWTLALWDNTRSRGRSISLLREDCDTPRKVKCGWCVEWSTRT